MVKKIEGEKGELETMLSKISSIFEEKLNDQPLESKIKEVYEQSIRENAQIAELSQENETLKKESQEQNGKFRNLENTCSSLEEQKEKLIDQNKWLEEQIDKFRGSSMNTESNFNKIDTLEREISTFKMKSSNILEQKDSRINELENHISQLQKNYELLDLEFLKLQKSKDLQIQELEFKYKKQS